jgi:polar amino acid transport system permease protein
MPEPTAPSITEVPLKPASGSESVGRRLVDLPWWFIGIVVVILWAGVGILIRPNYNEAFQWIKVGIVTTLVTSVTAYLLAIIIGLLTGLGRMSHNVVIRNTARLYVELVRGIPMLVLIFFIAFVGVPAGIDLVHSLGLWFASIGFTGMANLLASLENQAVPMLARAILALAITYGAFLAEVFRAGIQSIGRGQMEAARSLGMGYGQAMRFIILPQAIRNILPALGNDFVSMVKDSSLVSVLAVRDMTQIARLYAGSTFRFREAYVTLAVLYLTMTVILSLGVATIERRLRKHD